MLKTGRNRINHFAHVNPIACKFFEGESDDHLKCKMETLRKTPGVTNAALERPVAGLRPDVSANIRGVPVANEIHISSLSLDTIMRPTIGYAQNGIYVLWLLQWTPKLDSKRYIPKLWEKWIHAVSR